MMYVLHLRLPIPQTNKCLRSQAVTGKSDVIIYTCLFLCCRSIIVKVVQKMDWRGKRQEQRNKLSLCDGCCCGGGLLQGLVQVEKSGLGWLWIRLLVMNRHKECGGWWSVFVKRLFKWVCWEDWSSVGHIWQSCRIQKRVQGGGSD